MLKEDNQWLSTVREIAARSNPADHQGEILFYGASNFYFWYEMAKDLAPWPILNHGFGGSTDPDLVLFADELLYPYAPKLVFLQTGSNDYILREGSDADKIAACMAYKHEMLNQFRSHLPHTDFVFMSGLHLPGRKEYRALTQEINRQLSAWAQQEPHLHFVDADAMTLTGTAYHDELFVEDMIHLNHEGQLRWAKDYILPMIETLMK